MAGQINLYNPALRRQTDPLCARIVAGGAALLLAIVGAAAVWAGSAARQAEGEARDMAAQVKTAKDHLAALQQQAARKPGATLAGELSAAQAAIGARRDILAMLDSGTGATQGFVEYFRGFARQAPGGLWLTGFTIGAGGAEMEIRGRALSASLLPEYIRRLNGEPAFQGRGFSALDLRQKREAAPGAGGQQPGQPFVEFTLVPVKPTGGKS
ncbi:MAG: PilN domain-containing protein [Candidatus Nitricoxidivorans perseverans]|uniref:PilN domain-containing protein n=1 Tax=Candidatus Nitricoxidivorans perseverans TaxID=2975601 RepID=A0AA49FKQ4_9PROT|nr:MAG: PilN domain-containing protein [Candidatus Nitricoxidivorans perseverans]